MAYTDYELNWQSGSKTPITVVAQTTDTSSTPLVLTGKGRHNWGEPLQENLLKLLENFSSPSAPLHPTHGMIWYDSTEKILKVFQTNNTWDKIYSVSNFAAAVAPPNPTIGQIWYDIPNDSLNIWVSPGVWDPIITNSGLCSYTVPAHVDAFPANTVLTNYNPGETANNTGILLQPGVYAITMYATVQFNIVGSGFFYFGAGIRSWNPATPLSPAYDLAGRGMGYTDHCYFPNAISDLSRPVQQDGIFFIDSPSYLYFHTIAGGQAGQSPTPNTTGVRSILSPLRLKIARLSLCTIPTPTPTPTPPTPTPTPPTPTPPTPTPTPPTPTPPTPTPTPPTPTPTPGE
jgi:hypothetical protein